MSIYIKISLNLTFSDQLTFLFSKLLGTLKIQHDLLLLYQHFEQKTNLISNLQNSPYGNQQSLWLNYMEERRLPALKNILKISRLDLLICQMPFICQLVLGSEADTKMRKVSPPQGDHSLMRKLQKEYRDQFLKEEQEFEFTSQ